MVGIELFVRHFLAIYFVMVGLHYTAQSYALSERTGFTHINYGPRFSLVWWGRHVFNVFRAAILLVCLGRLFVEVDPWLGIFQLLYQPWLIATGAITLLVSFVCIDYVHSYMHKDWRSGFGLPESGHELITTGPFSRSRNPLFIGILIGQIGFFLALPSVFSLICLVIGMVVVTNQARKEEVVLQHTFGKEYETYQKNVPRWL